MIGRKCLLAAAVAWLAAAHLAALPADRTISQYVHRSWTVEQGLPHGTVRGFLQTPDGYLWLATYEGLVRFNGEEFRIFDRSSTPGMPSNATRILCRTGKDTIWIGTNDGLMRDRGGRFDAISLPGGPTTINAMIEAPDGSLWLGTAGGKLIRIAGDRAEVMRLNLPAGQITALAVTGQTMWIGTTAGLLRHTRGTTLAEPVAGLTGTRIVALASDGAAVLAGTATGLARVDGNRVERIDGGLPHDQVTAVHRDRDGNLWIGTYSHGLFRVGGGGIAAYGLADGLLNPTIRAIFEDDEGSIWIGSNGGLEQFRAGAFINWGKREGIDDDFVRTIFADRGGVLHVGSANGLYRREDGIWIREKGPAGILSMEQSRDGTRWLGTSDGLYRISGATTRLLTVADGLSNNTIRAVHEDRRGNLWAATDFSVSRIRADGRIESFARAGLAGYAIAIAETRDGRIWIAGGFGLAEFDGERLRIHSAPRELPSNRLFAMAADADQDGTVWLATDGDGLIRFRDGRAAKITTAQGLASDKAVSLVDDGKGQLWIGTVRGVFATSKHELNAVADGAASQLVSRFFDENDGLGSRQCNGAANPSALRTSDGRIWLATARGVSALSGNSTPPPLRAPIIESVSFDGRPAAMETLRSIPPGVNRIEIDFTAATFRTPERMRVHYRLVGYDDTWIDGGTKRAITYTNLPAGDYRFLLESSPDGIRWRGTSLPLALRPHFYQTRWFLILSVLALAALLLAAHNMRLHISRERARHLAELVEDRTRQISEEKERTEEALRQTEAAKIEAEAAWREAERHERMVEDALVRAESASRAKSIFLANTSHELRTPLNAIIGFSGLLIENASSRLESRHVGYLQNIQSSGEYLLGHINNILDLSRIEAGRTELQPESIILQFVVDEIAAVMKGVATPRQVSIDVDIPNDFPLIEADPTHVKQILYNLISNAVKFSPGKSTVTVSARRVPPSEALPDAIEIRVADQGIGIDPKDHDLIFQEFGQAEGTNGERPQGTGLGLTLVKRFVEMHGGTIRVESGIGMGSVFVIVMPRTQTRARQGPRRPAPART